MNYGHYPLLVIAISDVDWDADDGDEDEDADVTHRPSLVSAHLSFPRQIWPHIARQRFVPSVRLDLHISRKRISTFVKTWICADLIHANLCQTLNTEIRIESV